MKYQQHQKFLNQFKLALQKEFPRIRIFDRHVGMFYTRNDTPIQINKKGMADLYAFYPIEFGIINIEFEIKTGSSQQSPDQKRWQEFIEKMNGKYYLVRDIDETIKDLRVYISSLI